MTAKQLKFTKARRSYKCGACAGTIEPGDLYKRRTITRTVAQEPSVELRDGHPTVVENSFRVHRKVCHGCVQSEEPKSGAPVS